MAKQEAFLSNDDLGDSLDSAEALLKKHNDFETSLAAQDVKFSLLDEFAKVSHALLLCKERFRVRELICLLVKMSSLWL